MGGRPRFERVGFAARATFSIGGNHIMKTSEKTLDCAALLGQRAVDAVAKARDFLRERDTATLLGLVGQTFPGLALPGPEADKARFPLSYGGGKPCGDDLLAGKGMFYVTESGKLMLDCTAGHYQMTWGYDHPELVAVAEDGMRRGIVWDNHSNIPSLPVKQLANELVELAGDSGLDRALVGVCTGSVACGAALKIMLARYFADAERCGLGPPVVIALEGNYHGTDVAAQSLRGMWPGLVAGMEAVRIEPNDDSALAEAFEKHGRRVAGFWAEPVMMNREAIAVNPAYLQKARALCSQCDALLAMDEIQTCFWYPEQLMFRRLGFDPDLVVVGKGMTAGFHPLSALLFRSDLDILEQYDAISTNGNASLAALVGLANLRLIERDAERIERQGARYHAGLEEVAAEHPDLIEGVNGDGFLSGMKFRDREDALGFHKAAVARGLWLRAHAYHPGHRTVLSKFALTVDDQTSIHVLNRMRELLTSTPWR